MSFTKARPIESIRKHLAYNAVTGSFVRLTSRGKARAGLDAGQITAKGYLYIGVAGGRYMAHRLAWLFHYGEWPVGQIDHINRVKTDNRICNLRVVNDIENQRNRPITRNNSSGIPGVYWDKCLDRWKATIGIEGKILHLGVSKDFFEACCVRKSAEIKHGFHPNHGKPDNQKEIEREKEKEHA